MIDIKQSQEVHAPVESVWKIFADLENEHKYWDALRRVKILAKKENEIEREVRIPRGPLGEAKSHQKLVVDSGTKSSTLLMTKGPMLGTRKIELQKISGKGTRIDVHWEFEMKGVPSFALGFVRDNISEVTTKALAQIAKEAEKELSVLPS
ncbi:MAG: SRPBCC family protein [Thaumarchaeota archaeon]|nr:SRPBCC family protein [Nitrososphaerota archaeon]